MLVQIGLGFALAYALVALVQVIRRSERVLFVDVLLAFAAALVVLAALVSAHLDGIPSVEVSLLAVGGGAGFAAFGLLVALIEWRRPKRLEQSRGLLALGTGVMIALSGVLTPVVSAYMSLPPSPPAEAFAQAGDADTVVAGETTDEAGEFAENLQSERFEVVFVRLFDIVGEETGLDVDGVLSALDNGQTVEQLVQQNNGNLQRVIDDLTALVIEQLRISAANGEITPVQAVGGIMFAERGIRMVVSNDLRTLQRMGRENDPTLAEMDEVGEGESFFAFLTGTPFSAADAATTGDSPTPTHTPTPTLSATATATRTPQPTPTPTNTRFFYASPTPTLTPTLPAPCVVVTLYNVNLRAGADATAELLLTIPFETAVNAFGRNRDATWWFVEYEGRAGWLNGEFVRATSACNALPVR